MSLDKNRFEESRKMISEYLVKEHDDGDGDSLFCRFGDISQAYQDMIRADAAFYGFLASHNENRQKLWELCSDFVKYYGISCEDEALPAEVVMGRGIELIVKIAKIVG